MQLRFREFEFPVAQPLALVDSFVEITGGNRFQAVTLFDVAGGNHLTGEQGVEQPDDIDAQVVLDELRIELSVVGNLNRARCSQHLPERSQRVAKFQVTLSKTIQIDDVNAIRRSELNQSQATEVWIELGRLSV